MCIVSQISQLMCWIFEGYFLICMHRALWICVYISPQVVVDSSYFWMNLKVTHFGPVCSLLNKCMLNLIINSVYEIYFWKQKNCIILVINMTNHHLTLWSKGWKSEELSNFSIHHHPNLMRKFPLNILLIC